MNTTVETAGPDVADAVAARLACRLTVGQTRAIEGLPRSHELVGLLGATPILRRPDGKLFRLPALGARREAMGVLGTQHYLDVRG